MTSCRSRESPVRWIRPRSAGPTRRGPYRFWRDFGYAAGALVVGIRADAAGLNATVIAT